MKCQLCGARLGAVIEVCADEDALPMMTIGAHEILIIILAWVVISFGPLVAQLTIAMVRRFMGQSDNTGSDGLSGGRA